MIGESKIRDSVKDSANFEITLHLVILTNDLYYTFSLHQSQHTHMQFLMRAGVETVIKNKL